MAFTDDTFLVIPWIPGTTEVDIAKMRVETNSDRAAAEIWEGDPNVDYWVLKIQTNRNSVTCKKTNKKNNPGPSPVNRELREVEANTEGVVGGYEVVVP